MSITGSCCCAATPDLKDTITVVNGRVTELKHPILWNGIVAGTTITRNADGSFTCDAKDPEHGGWTRTGTLDEILEPFHPNIAAGYRQAFIMEDPTADNLQAAFPAYRIITWD